MIQTKYYKIDNKIGKRIALISDIHYSDIFKIDYFENIISNLKVNKPDYICIPGDIVDDASYFDNEKVLKPLIEFLNNISKIAPVIISIGNHDFVHKRNNDHIFVGTKILSNTLKKIKNVHVLNNEKLELDNICFIGLTNSFNYYYGEGHEDINMFIDELNINLYNKIDNEKYNVLLCHTPIHILKDKVIDKCEFIMSVDLILSGHTHNGMIPRIVDKIIKNNRGIYGPFNTIFPKYARGSLKKVNNKKTINLIISGGITKISKTHSKLLRIFNIVYQNNIEYIDI